MAGLWVGDGERVGLGQGWRDSGEFPPSFLAELAGVVDVTRSLTQCVGGGGEAGRVEHWCDNEGVVKVIRGRKSRTPRKWRATAGRLLWAELVRWLDWWESIGGSWESRWVKGHLERVQSRTRASYTAAEWGNIAADRMADWAMENGVIRGEAMEDKPSAGQWGGGVECGGGERL